MFTPSQWFTLNGFAVLRVPAHKFVVTNHRGATTRLTHNTNEAQPYCIQCPYRLELFRDERYEPPVRARLRSSSLSGSPEPTNAFLCRRLQGDAKGRSAEVGLSRPHKLLLSVSALTDLHAASHVFGRSENRIHRAPSLLS